MIPQIHAYIRSAGRRKDRDAVMQKLAGKRYPRMPRVDLPEPKSLSTPIETVLKERASVRDFVEFGQIDLIDLSAILSHALAVRDDGKRPYPSGGARYPIETYIINRSIGGIPHGVHHYLPEDHALEHLWEMPSDITLFKETPKASWAEHCSAVVIFTSVWERSAREYGDFCYQLALIEAGHMAQNISLASTAVGIGSCPLSGYDDETIARLLGIDNASEQPVYSIALSTVAKRDI